MDKALLFVFLAVFPFGQLLGHWPIDIIVGLIFLYTIIAYPRRSKAFKLFGGFILIAVFSYFFSFSIFTGQFPVTGALYLFRLILYWFFLDFCVNIINKYAHIKPLLFKSLVAILVVVAIFGWFQYFFYPDLTALKFIDWDDHLFRLAGTFLDPGFTALFLAIGATLSFSLNPFLPIFFIVSLAFTYSRAGYLAFMAAMLITGIIGKKIIKSALFTLVLVLAVIFLPKPAGEGVNLARTFSISSRISNYIETIAIIRQSPLFGSGYNNICQAKKIYLQKYEPKSHSCSGSDSSLLLILATTGITGLIVFISFTANLFKSIKRGKYYILLLASFGALFVHSIFTNSMFYPFVMGLFAVLISLQTLKENN